MLINFVWNVLICIMMFVLATALILRWLNSSGLTFRRFETPSLLGWTGEEGPVFREDIMVFAATLIFRVLVFVSASMFAFILLEGEQSLEALWTRWDSGHYVKLVEQGYAGYTEGGQHLFLVFYPLYVWLVRVVRMVVGDTLISGIMVSFLCYSGGCIYVYRLAVEEYGRAVAWRAVLFLSLFPFAFFFGAMMTEGLFLLTTAAGLYHIRRHEWFFAGFWGVLAAMTRMHGLLLVGAAFAELIQEVKPFTPSDRWPPHGLRTILCALPSVFLPFLGTVVYLMLNYTVDGDPFAFVKHQEHWNQGFQWVSQVLGYLVRNALTAGDLTNRMLIWFPELLLFVLFYGLLWHERGRHRSMLMFYAFASLILNYSLSWLLSAGRYLSCAVPFFLFISCLTARKPRLTAVLSGAMGALFMMATVLYLVGKPIM